jgi:hypothetical protein
MDLDHCVPLFDGHIEDHPVTDDPGIVHHHVYASPKLQSHVEERPGPFRFGDVFEVRMGLPTDRPNLLHDSRGRPGIRSRAVPLATQIVDHNPGSFPSEQQRLAPADAPPCTGDERDLPVQHPHTDPPPLTPTGRCPARCRSLKIGTPANEQSHRWNCPATERVSLNDDQ